MTTFLGKVATFINMQLSITNNTTTVPPDRNPAVPERRVQRLHLPGVEHDGVLPVVGAARAGRRRVGRGGPARAVPAGVPGRAARRPVPQHGGLRAARGPAARRHQLAARLALR